MRPVTRSLPAGRIRRPRWTRGYTRTSKKPTVHMSSATAEASSKTPPIHEVRDRMSVQDVAVSQPWAGR